MKLNRYVVALATVLAALVATPATAQGDGSDRAIETTPASKLARAAATAGDPVSGEVFRDCDVCPVMVALPGGDVALGQFEVTLEEYRAFAAAVPSATGRCTFRRDWRNPGFTQTERHPVACVSWNEAQAYLKWLSLETGHRYRLPTDAEWDRGAAGSSRGCYHLYNGKRPGTCPVGSYEPSDAGLFDMVGNLWEWTDDCWEGNCDRRVLRGAGFASQNWQMRPITQTWAGPDLNSRTIGFRVARTLP